MSRGKRFKEEKNKKEKIGKRFITLIQLIFIIVIILASIKLYKWYNENKRNDDILDDISNAITEEDNEMKVDFEKLKSINKNTVAYIKVNGTNVEYPVVQYTDNSFYLTHSFDDSYNSSGWIFTDYRNKFDGTDKNIIVYGHNRRNGTMFANLREALNKEWYDIEENRKIRFITENENCIYEIFSIYKIEDEDYYITTNFNTIKYGEFLNTIKKRSISDFGIDINEDDKVLTLSTCDNNNQYRVVIHAKKIIN